MNISFTGKRALVTGAGKGIGYDIAKALAAGGAETYALSKTQANLEKLKAEVPSIHIICVDLREWDKTRAAVEKIVKEAGPIHLLVNNAAVLMTESFMEVTNDMLDETMDVNVKACFNVAQVVSQALMDAKLPGSIVNISSITSSRGFKEIAAYTTSKGAVDQLTRLMSLDLGAHKIRVNAVNPTITFTAMARQLTEQPMFKYVLNRCPLGRHAEVEDIVYPVLFLLSDKSAMVNGVTLPIDGGFWAN